MANGNGGPPIAEETEATVLGTTLSGQVRLEDPELFGREAHRRICAAAVRIQNRGGATGRETLLDELSATGEIEQVGGPDYVASLFDRWDVLGHAARVEELHERARRRELHEIGRSIQLTASQPETGLFEISAGIRERLDNFERISAATSSRLIDDVALEALPKPEQLIDGIMPAGGLGVVFGPPGSGKTFVVTDWALSLQTGFRWQRRSVRPGPVVFVSAEGSAGLGARVAAWKHAHDFTGRAGLQFLREPVNLMESAEVGRFIAGDLRSLEEPPVLVIFDTLARCMIGGDENSAEDMGLAIAAADRIRTETGAAVLLVHHTNKGGELERGSTALRGAADTMVSVKDEDGIITLACEKQKDSEPFGKVQMRLERVLDSCVIEPATVAWQVATEELTQAEREALETLSRDFLDDGATLTAWKTSGNIADRTIYRVRTSLVTKGYVEQIGQGRGARHVLTDKGREAVPANLPDPANNLPAGNAEPCQPIGGAYREPPDGRVEAHAAELELEENDVEP